MSKKPFTISVSVIDPDTYDCEMSMMSAAPSNVVAHCEGGAATIARAEASDGNYIYEYYACDRCLGFAVRALADEAARYEKGETA